MSSAHGVNLIVEWSPRKVTVLDVASQSVTEYSNTDSLPHGGKTAILAISRKSIFVRATRVPNAAPEEIRMVVQVKLAELFPLPPHELAYDFLLLSDVNAEGRLALIMALPVIELRRALEKLTASGIKVVRTLPLALASPLISDSVGVQDAAVVEGGSDFASVDLVSGGILRYSRVIPPNALVDVEVNRTFSASGLPSTNTIAVGKVDFPEADKRTSLSSLQALATGHVDRFKVNIELPEVVAKRELNARKRRGVMAGAMLLISFVAAYFSYSDWYQLKSKADDESARSKKTLDTSTAYLKTVTADSNRQQAITTTLNGAFHPAQTVSDITTLAANCVPAGIWLTGLNVERGKEITIRGTATDNDAVSTYVDALKNFSDPTTGGARFRDAKFLFATNGDVQKVPVVQFSVSAFPIGNLPIALQQKSGVSAAAQ